MAASPPGEVEPLRKDFQSLLEGCERGPSLEEARAKAALQEALFGQPQALVLGRYRLGEALGRGGIGLVFEAYDPELERQVAIKFVRGPEAHEELDNLRREARVLASLQHPNVVTVFDVGRYDEASLGLDADASAGLDVPQRGVFMVMERIEGQELADARGTSGGWRDKLGMMLQAGRGLCAAHELGIVHGDFKPANTMVDGSGRVRVFDFGLARLGPEMGANADATGGTPAYMSPEQHRGEVLTPASDQYSFALSTIELLCGERPFRDSTGSLPEAKQAPELHLPESFRRLPRRVRRPLERALRPNASERWPSLDALLRRLEVAAGPRRGVWAAAVGAVGVGLGAAAILALEPVSEGPPECSEASALVERWDDATRDGLRARFVEHGPVEGAGNWRAFERRMQARLVAFADARETVCAALGDEEASSDATAYLQLGCLRLHRAELEAVLDGVAVADRRALRRAASAVEDVSLVEACLDASAVRRAVAERPEARVDPHEEELRRQVRELGAGALMRGSRPALEDLDAAFARGDHDDAPLARAEATLLRGRFLRHDAQFDASEAALESAIRQAEALGVESVRAAAMVMLVAVVGDGLGRHEDALAWAGRARPVVERLDDPRLAAELAEFEGHVLVLAEQYDAGLARQREGLATLREHGLGDSSRALRLEHNVAVSLSYAKRWTEAEAVYRRVLEVRERELGPSHPTAGYALVNLALAQHSQGRWEEAIETYELARVNFANALGTDHAAYGGVLWGLGDTYGDTGRFEQALPLLLEARSIYAQHFPETHTRVVKIEETIGEILDALDASPDGASR